MDTIKTERYLNLLLEKTYDAQRGYSNAAEVTERVQLKNWFVKQGARRTLFAASLTGELKGMNKTPELDGSFTGDMHRGWMNIKAAMSPNTDESILEECLTGDQSAVKEYDLVLEHKKVLPPTVVSILETQKDEIQATVNKVKTLENFAHHQHL